MTQSHFFLIDIHLCCYSMERLLHFFLCSPKAKCCEIKFPKLSFCLSKRLSVAQGENKGVKELESEKKKVFNSLQPLLIVPREQQIGPGYKTLIDL